MSAAARAITAAAIAGFVGGLVALAVEKNIWLAMGTGGLIGVVVFFGTYSYYGELARAASPDEPGQSRRAIPLSSEWRTRHLVASGQLEVAGRRLTATGDWLGARRLIAANVTMRQVREPLLHLLQAARSLDELRATLPPRTPEAFKMLARDTVNDVFQRLWAKTAILARLSAVTLPATAEAEVAAEAQRVQDLAKQVDDAATDLLKLSLAGYDSQGIRAGTELLTAVRRKAEILLTIAGDDLG